MQTCALDSYMRCNHSNLQAVYTEHGISIASYINIAIPIASYINIAIPIASYINILLSIYSEDNSISIRYIHSVYVGMLEAIEAYICSNTVPPEL